jgi:hypothetical protein
MVWLREMGYRYGLGFRLARPVPAGMMGELVAEVARSAAADRALSTSG